MEAFVNIVILSQILFIMHSYYASFWGTAQLFSTILMASKSFLIEELERRFLGRRPTGGCEDGEEVGFEGNFPRLP